MPLSENTSRTGHRIQTGDAVRQLMHHWIRGLHGILRIIELGMADGLRSDGTFIEDLINTEQRVHNLVLLHDGIDPIVVTARASDEQ